MVSALRRLGFTIPRRAGLAPREAE